MKKFLTISGVIGGLLTAYYFGNPLRPYDLVGIKFCPRTSNDTQSAQYKLDREYCDYERKVLKSVWEEQQFQASKPFADTTDSPFKIRDIPTTDSYPWAILFAPLLSLLGYLSWAKECEDIENKYHAAVESFKTNLKTTTRYSQRKRSFDSKLINSIWDKKEVESGLVPITAMQERFLKQSEIADKTHTSTIKQFDLGDSEAEKKIAENLRDKAKADKERDKISGNKVSTPNGNDASPNLQQQRVTELTLALKKHEDGWLWTVVEAIKPVWIFGDMGTGKTNSAVAISLLRNHCLNIPVYQIADRHLNGENSDVWNLLQTTKKHDTDDSILSALTSVVERREERINGRVKEPEQFILDEFTQLAKLPGGREIVERFITSTFSDTRKAKEYFIGVTHNLTNSTFGEGSASMRKGAFYLQKFTLDNIKPLPRIVVKSGLKDEDGNNLDDVEKTLPSWFEANTIWSHFVGELPIEFD